MDEVENVQKWGETDMKLVIIGLLSALLIQIAPVQASPVNNSVDSHKKQVVQAKANEHKTDHSQEPSPQLPKATETGAVQKKVPQKPPTGKYEILQAAGIPSRDWSAADYIFHKESSWRPAAVNYLGCKGLGQSCPGGSGLVKDCPDWRVNKVCQVKHFDKYAKRRYGGWTFALAFWQSHGWW